MQTRTNSLDRSQRRSALVGKCRPSSLSPVAHRHEVLQKGASLPAVLQPVRTASSASNATHGTQQRRVCYREHDTENGEVTSRSEIAELRAIITQQLFEHEKLRKDLERMVQEKNAANEIFTETIARYERDISRLEGRSAGVLQSKQASPSCHGGTSTDHKRTTALVSAATSFVASWIGPTTGSRHHHTSAAPSLVGNDQSVSLAPALPPTQLHLPLEPSSTTGLPPDASGDSASTTPWQAHSGSEDVKGATPATLPERPASGAQHRAFWKSLMGMRSQRGQEAGRSVHQACYQQSNPKDVADSWARMLRCWDPRQNSKQFRKLLEKGVPYQVRGALWKKAIDNRLLITPPLYDATIRRLRVFRRYLVRTSLRYRTRLEETFGTSIFNDEEDDDAESTASCPLCAALWPTSLVSAFETISADLKRTFPRLGVHLQDAASASSSSSSPAPETVASTLPSLSSREQSKTLSVPSSRLPRITPSVPEEAKSGIPPLPIILGIRDGKEMYCQLRLLLETFALFRPEIGYVQGMAYIAAMLLLYIRDDFDAFVCFSNLMCRESLHAFYTFDLPIVDMYFRTFDALLRERLPDIATQLDASQIPCSQFLMDWMYTLFTRCLPFDVVSSVWDFFLVDGDVVLFQMSLALLHHLYTESLLLKNDDQLSSLLSSSCTTHFSSFQAKRFLESAVAFSVSRDRLERMMRNTAAVPPAAPVEDVVAVFPHDVTDRRDGVQHDGASHPKLLLLHRTLERSSARPHRDWSSMSCRRVSCAVETRRKSMSDDCLTQSRPREHDTTVPPASGPFEATPHWKGKRSQQDPVSGETTDPDTTWLSHVTTQQRVTQKEALLDESTSETAGLKDRGRCVQLLSSDTSPATTRSQQRAYSFESHRVSREGSHSHRVFDRRKMTRLFQGMSRS